MIAYGEHCGCDPCDGMGDMGGMGWYGMLWYGILVYEMV